MALNDAVKLVNNGKMCVHGLVVGNTFRVVALDDSMKLVGRFNGLFLYNLLVFYNIEHNLWGDNRQTANLFIAEKLVCNLNDSLFPEFP